MNMADPKQVFGTEGIAAMERPSAVTRFFMKIVQGAERHAVGILESGHERIVYRLIQVAVEDG